MSYEPQSHTVVVRHMGTWDRDASDRNIQMVYAMCREHGTGRVLVDHRRSRVELDTLALFERGRELTEPETPPPVHRLAFLHPADRAEDYAFFATVMTNRGTRVRAFADDEAAALAWLGQD